MRLNKNPQCVHKSQKQADKGEGRCSRCAMPTAPLNHIRFWSPFVHSISKFEAAVNPVNAELIEAFIRAPDTRVPHVQTAA